MQHRNTVFHALLASIPWAAFDRLVTRHAADKRVRRLSCKTQLVALLYGQLAGFSRLRALVTGFASHTPRLYHLGVAGVKRSSLAEANAQRPAALFAELFAALVVRAQPRLARAVGECIRLIDSTALPLPRRTESWARYSAGVCGAKMHIVYDPDADCPLYAAVSARALNDITAAQTMPIEPGATYVFDLGYYDYAWWAKLHAAGCRIVTRFKSNTPLRVHSERLRPAGDPIRSDRTGYLPARQAKSRQNPMSELVREIVVQTETGRWLRLLCNDLSSDAEVIAALYKRRWAIELFFRWVKQTLKIRHFLGTSENAVRIQIAVALIAYLLLRLANAKHLPNVSPLQFARLVQANIMHRKSPANLLQQAQPPPTADPRQRQLTWAPI